MPKLTQVKETKRGRYALFFDGEFAFRWTRTPTWRGCILGMSWKNGRTIDQTKSDTRKAVDKAMDLLAP